MEKMREVLERHQVLYYLVALIAGVIIGGQWKGAEDLEFLINPLLGLLLFATFLAVPVRTMGAAIKDFRFLGVLLAANFLLVPPLVWLITRPIADNQVLPAVLLVLLCPCVDYVIVFSRLAGGAAHKLLAATPILLLAQMLALPVFMRLLGGPDMAMTSEPFVQAFIWLIAVPLALAWLVQLAMGKPSASRRRTPFNHVAMYIGFLAQCLMVPLMMAVLFVVAVSQARRVSGSSGMLLNIIPIYVAFAALMVLIMLVATRRWGAARARKRAKKNGADKTYLSHAEIVQARRERIALIFSPVTRNSLVVLPFAFAMESEVRAIDVDSVVPVATDAASATVTGLLPAAVVTQTMVELLVMLALVRLCHRLMPLREDDQPVIP